ncbi:PAS domain S-box protein [Methanocella sp. MCL-LM]|uniref:PAS domain S-box protein n=1 Tax=Methanocella sp. MCL-LM TaxID=3412035 RepID=UPI003C7755FF
MDKNESPQRNIDELRRQIAILRALPDAVPIGLYMVDHRTDTICFSNEAFFHIWGIEHLKGMVDRGEVKNSEIIPYLVSLCGGNEDFAGHRWQILDPDDDRVVRCKVMLADGRHLSLNSSQVRDARNEYQGRVYAFEDVTQIVKAEEEAAKSKERYKEMADLLPQIVFEMDLGGALTFVNRSAYEVMGYTAEDFQRGLNVIEMIVPEEREMAMRNIQRVLNGEKTGQEYTFLRKDGSRFPVTIHSTVILREGKPAGLRGFIVDITEQRASEDRLRRLSAAIEQSPSSVMIFDTEGKIMYVNPQFSRITGYSSDIAVGRSLFSLSFSNARPEQLNEVMEAIRSGQEWRGEIEYKAKHGRANWVSAHIFPIKDADGKITHFIDAEEDITERKEADEKLLLTQTSIDNFTDSCIWMDMNLDIRYVNEATCRSLGYTREELLTMNIKDIDPCFSEEFVGKITASMVKYGSYRFESIRKTRDGRLFPVDISCKYYRQGKKEHIISFERDITERKLEEEKLLLTQTSIDHFHDPCAWSDANGKFVYVNDAACHLFGYSREEFLNLKVTDIEMIYMGDRYTELYDMLKAQGSAHFETMGKTKDGKIVPVEISIKHHSYENKNYVISFLRDITERKQAENKLSDNLHFLQVLLDAIPVPVYYKDVHERYIGCNNAFEKYLGRSREEIIGRNAYDINPKDLADIYHEADMALLNSGDDQLFESKVRHADGNYRDVIFYKAVFQGTDGKPGGIIGSLLDITDRKLTEERIKSSLREKEVLLKEVHHRVKNNMQIISSLLNLQLSGIDQEPVKQILTESQSRIRSIALVHERMYMSNDLAKIDFDEYLKSLGNQLLVTYRANSGRVRLTIEGTDIHLGVDQAVPCGLIMNELISNSLKHAFPDSRPGTIKIQLASAKHNRIIIEDDGIGMPKDFSLSNVQSMGMQLVSALVEQMDGTIELDRSSGTRYTITFPVR